MEAVDVQWEMFMLVPQETSCMWQIAQQDWHIVNAAGELHGIQRPCKHDLCTVQFKLLGTMLPYTQHSLERLQQGTRLNSGVIVDTEAHTCMHKLPQNKLLHCLFETNSQQLLITRSRKNPACTH
jgi:hypothetical protein